MSHAYILRPETVGGPGCYALLHKGRVVYIGKTDRDISLRVMEHACEKAKVFDKWAFVKIPPQMHFRAPLAVESALIRRFMPKYNGAKRGSYRGSTGPLPGDDDILFPSNDTDFAESMKRFVEVLNG